MPSNGVLLPTLNLQLVDTLNAALRTLIDQIPSFDTVKSQLEKAVGKSIADTFGVPVTTVTFVDGSGTAIELRKTAVVNGSQGMTTTGFASRDVGELGGGSSLSG